MSATVKEGLSKGEIKKRLLSILEMRKQQEADMYKLFILPLKDNRKKIMKYLKGEANLEDVIHNTEYVSNYMMKALQGGKKEEWKKHTKTG